MELATPENREARVLGRESTPWSQKNVEWSNPKQAGKTMLSQKDAGARLKCIKRANFEKNFGVCCDSLPECCH
jgi:hypothetical protein